MPRKPYTLYKRKTKKNKRFIYYCQFRDDDGNRMTARSTGQTSKTAADAWAIDQLRRGLITLKKNITFGQYAEGWWVPDKCKYIKGKIARGSRISPDYTDGMLTYSKKHILPYFTTARLRNITADQVEEWLLALREKPGRSGTLLSPTTVNHCLTCLKIMLKEAVNRGYLGRSPAAGIKQLAERPKEKAILTVEEMRTLFQDENIDRVWNGDLFHYTLNLLAASTGMRMGEVQGLQVQHVHFGYVGIHHTWSRKYGLKEGAKWGSQREIPIPSKTNQWLQELVNYSPFNELEDLVFYGQDRTMPVYNKTISENLYRAFDEIGISAEERRTRNITFHSWRHFYNSLMRGKIHDSKLRRLTGHKTLEMTEHYTTFNLEDFKDVVEVQERLFQ
jgi:integrase